MLWLRNGVVFDAAVFEILLGQFLRFQNAPSLSHEKHCGCCLSLFYGFFCYNLPLISTFRAWVSDFAPYCLYCTLSSLCFCTLFRHSSLQSQHLYFIAIPIWSSSHDIAWRALIPHPLVFRMIYFFVSHNAWLYWLDLMQIVFLVIVAFFTSCGSFNHPSLKWCHLRFRVTRVEETAWHNRYNG